MESTNVTMNHDIVVGDMKNEGLVNTCGIHALKEKDGGDVDTALELPPDTSGAKPLEIDKKKLERYTKIANTDITSVPKEHQGAYELAHITLNSKQCNEPYEILISEVLGLDNNPKKHGWDAFDNIDNPTTFYEFKPSSNTTNPSGTINDDSVKKIEKCIPGTNAFMILAGINKTTYTLDIIYKFPMTIYHEDRLEYLNAKLEQNKKMVGKQTRITYSVTVSKSKTLCKKHNMEYWVWKR